MKKYWWKILGILLLCYTVVGGLLTPLKTGITAVNVLKIPTLSTSAVIVEIYNPNSDFAASDAILYNGRNTFHAKKIKWNGVNALTAEFLPILGKQGNDGEMYNLYVKANGHWMAFPSALSIEKNVLDTSIISPEVLRSEEISGNPDHLKGFPNRPILNESIRNLLYHVPMWFSMIFLMAMAAWHAVKYLRTGNLDSDTRSDALIRTGLLAGILGCITGSVWASVTWGTWWPRDPKMNGVAIGMLMYLAYLLLRSSLQDEHQKARIAAVYNLFIFPIFIALIWIMPKLGGDSLHPGAGGTVGFKEYDLDSTLRMFFYPAVAGWVMTFAWMASLLYRVNRLKSIKY